MGHGGNLDNMLEEISIKRASAAISPTRANAASIGNDPNPGPGASNMFYGDEFLTVNQVKPDPIAEEYLADGLDFVLDATWIDYGEKEFSFNQYSSRKTDLPESQYTLGEDMYSKTIFQQLDPQTAAEEIKLNTLLNRRSANKFFSFVLSTKRGAYIDEDKKVIGDVVQELSSELDQSKAAVKERLQEIVALGCVAIEEQIANDILKADVLQLENCGPSPSDPYLEHGIKLKDTSFSELKPVAKQTQNNPVSASKRLRTLTYLQQEDYSLLDRDTSDKVINKLLKKFKRNQYQSKLGGLFD